MGGLVKKVENVGCLCKKVENGAAAFFYKKWTFLNAGCIMYMSVFFILHFII